MRRFVTVLSLLVLCSSPLLAESPKGLEGLDTLVAQLQKEYLVPGLSLAIVQDGKVILLKGYGFRDAEQKQPVTPQTLFAIASVSKSFTVAGLGMLVDEKKLDWDRPVRDYLPEFRLHPRIPDERITARDLVAHRTGLPRHDGLWSLTQLDRRELFSRLHLLEPTRDLRQEWQYNNLMYMAAGVLQEKLSGQSWEEFTRRRLFEPLGMKRTNPSTRISAKDDNAAVPHVEVDGKLRPVGFQTIDGMGPAGSINSCAEDMSQYLLFLMNRGKYGDKQLLSQAQAEQMQSPQMLLPPQWIRLSGMDEDATYGLGLMVDRHRRERLIWHTGSLRGFMSELAFLPNKKIGVVILTNLTRRNGARLSRALVPTLFDRLLGESGIDWPERVRERTRQSEKQRLAHQEKMARERKAGTSPTHPLAELAGIYHHPAYGSLRVQPADKDLLLHFQGATLRARHYHYNRFQVVDTFEEPSYPLEDRLITFHVGPRGVVDRLTIDMETGIGEFGFSRKVARE